MLLGGCEGQTPIEPVLRLAFFLLSSTKRRQRLIRDIDCQLYPWQVLYHKVYVQAFGTDQALTLTLNGSQDMESESCNKVTKPCSNNIH